MSDISSVYNDDLWAQNYAPDVPRHINLPEHPIQKFLEDAAKKYGFWRTAFNFKGKKYSWKRFNHRANQIAEALQKRGLQKGDRVALMLPNSFEYAALYYGVLKAGGTVVNLDPRYTEEQITKYVKDSGAKFIATTDLKPFFGNARNAMKALGQQVDDLIVCPMDQSLPLGLKAMFNVFKRGEVDQSAYNMGYTMFRDFRYFSGRYKPVAISPKEDVAVLQFTGGTTGEPKAAMLTHYNIASVAHQARAWMPNAIEGKGASLAIIPFFHVFSMSAILNLSVRMGWTIHAMPKPNLNEAGTLIQRHKINFLGGVPQLFQGLARDFNGRLSTLTHCISGGAPMPADVKDEFEEKTGALVWEGIGMTENPVALCQPHHEAGAAGFVGIPFPNNEVRIVNVEDLAKGNLVDMPVGEIGEIIYRGPAVMKGYWNRPDATAKTFCDGWLMTGDLGRVDPETGQVRIEGRSKDLIIISGYNVYPKKGEDALMDTGKFTEVMVFGVPDKVTGEAAIAMVRPKEGITVTAQEIHSFLRSKLSRSEWVREVIVTEDELPRTNVGKLAKNLAQAAYAAGDYASKSQRFGASGGAAAALKIP